MYTFRLTNKTGLVRRDYGKVAEAFEAKAHPTDLVWVVFQGQTFGPVLRP